VIAVIEGVGSGALAWAGYVRSLYRFFRRFLVVLGTTDTGGARVIARSTLLQMKFTGVDAVGLVAALAALLGAIIVMQALSFLRGGGGAMVGTFIDLLVIRELAPLVTAFIIIGRSGSAITVDIGNMKAHGELDLLDAMGIDPLRYVVAPRMVGVTYAALCLCVVFDLVTIGGGYALASLAVDTPGPIFLAAISENISFVGIGVGLIKSAFFGVIIATISTWQGLAVDGPATLVPIHTQRSVVHSIVACVMVSVIISLVVNIGRLL